MQNLTIENITNYKIEGIQELIDNEVLTPGMAHLKLNKKPLLDDIKKIRNHLDCVKTFAIDSNLWIGKYSFGFKTLMIEFVEKNPNKLETDEHRKIVKIYNDKVFVSYHHYNNTTVGPLHYHLYSKSDDETLNEYCFELFNAISKLFSTFPKRNNKIEFVEYN